MSVPASYDVHATATYQGRDGVFTWTLYGPSGTAPDPAPVLTLSGRPAIPYGTASAAEFGGGMIAHSADYRFSDGSVLDGLMDGADPADYLCSLTGPDGHGGTYTVWTRPIQGEGQGSASPLVTPGATTALGTHDALAALDDFTGASASGVSLSDLFGRLWVALPGGADGAAVAGADFFEVWAAWPIASDAATDALLSRLRPSAEIAGDPEKGDPGTVEDQVRALCEGGTLTVYQPTDTTADEPRWEVAPRSRVGTALACTVVTSDGDGTTTSTAGTMPDRAEALPSYEADKPRTGARTVKRVGEIRLTGSSAIVYATDAEVLGTGEEYEGTVGTFTATPGLRFRVDIGVAFEPAEVRLMLAGTDGTTYYGPDWTTGSQTMGVAESTTADLPVGGDITYVLIGDEYLTEDQAFGAGAIHLEDASGDAVTSYLLTLGTAGGAAVSVALLPAFEAYDGSAWVGAPPYSGLVSGADFGTLPAAQAAERSAQQGADLRALVVNARGLWGPQSRFTLTGTDNGNARSPFAEDVTLVPVSGEPDLDTGYTRLVLVSAAES